MVKRAKRMQSVADIAKSREKNAACLLGQKQQFLDQQRERLLELVTYREEYARKFQSQGSLGLDARRLNEYRVFLEKLNLAIVQQRDRITQATGDCHVCHESWMNTRVHSKALDKVVDRFRHEEHKEQEKREQNELDERATQLGLSRSND